MVAMDQSPVRGELRYHAPLAGFTSWRTGGRAECLFRPADLEDLQHFVRRGLGPRPYTWLGLGSNVLVRDGGVRGTVIVLHGALGEIEFLEDGRVRVGAGAPCARVARSCAKAGLAGAAFLAGIPGTMGGALAMNAGCFGAQTWELVESVAVLDGAGRVQVRAPDRFQVGYRQVAGLAPGEAFVGGVLRLRLGDTEAEQARIRELLARRGRAQPSGASCGSVFRNPPGDHAGRLIEAAGLKGCCIGGACVSEKHANFILNTGKATAADIEALIRHVQRTVQVHHGVRLEPEVRILGEAS